MEENIALRLLSDIERREMISLTWGYVDGSLSHDETLLLAEEVISHEDCKEDPEDLLEELIERGLVFELRGNRIRSRFAETVRLISQLRQLFPGRDWRSSPRLVADFRIDRRPRRYPKRNLPADEVWQELPHKFATDTVRQALWNRLTKKEDGKSLPLARFQVDALKNLLPETNNDQATIITAGTGSGKTYCFYLPALVEIGVRLKPSRHYVAAVALYPRVELLKDQLTEAVGLAQKIAPVLNVQGLRPLRIGVLYGDTPNQVADIVPSDNAPKWKKHWAKLGDGYVCPLLRCPSCDGRLVWSDKDIKSNIERLYCVESSCGKTIDNLALTRQSLIQCAPDLLFTTTEMLNRRMTDPSMRGLFGLGMDAGERLSFILLDEVHTYSGMSGAQAALTLSRWRHLLGSSKAIRWVGLSATLRDAEAFFSTLTGVTQDDVTLITPVLGDMEEEGAEYQLALRGDPAGQTSLLSTTIQTVMLLTRMADRKSSISGKITEPSGGVVGERTFVFTDNLDVINRLYHSIADAEGYVFRNNRMFPKNGELPLAALRAQGNDDRERDSLGQWWWATEKLGRNLNDRLLLGRTSSQDAGVDASRDVIVATASLEVGFNDPGVGFVLQHKAPKNAAGFLQRKGRAGRRRGMRPWMVTVLSDYGRDRIAYTAYEQLFDPELPPLSLPVDNLYLLRIQAAFALIEWLFITLSSEDKIGHMWSLLAAPGRLQGKTRGRVIDLLSRLIRAESNGDSVRQSLESHLCGALRIDSNRLQTILWQPPRGLLLEVIPTLMRRVWCDWQLAYPTGDQKTEPFASHPLPEFLPANLFSDLALPEVHVVPERGENSTLPIVQALNQLVPGRVTRRFAPHDGQLSHWIPCDWSSGFSEIDPTQFILTHHAFSFGSPTTEAIRPWRVALASAPDNVLPTSNAWWSWESNFVPGIAPHELPCPQRGAWAGRLVRLEAHTYSRRSPLTVRRFAHDGVATIRVKDKFVITEHRVDFRLVHNGKPVAIGLEQSVDGLYVEFVIPNAQVLASLKTLPADVVAACKTSYFRKCVATDERMVALGNPFILDWLAQIFLAAVVLIADSGDFSIEDASQRVSERHLLDALDTLFPTPNSFQDWKDDEEEGETSAESDGSEKSEQRLVRRLRVFIGQEDILDRLKALSVHLGTLSTESWGQWLRDIILDTLAHASLEAAATILPRNSALDTLLVDPLPLENTGNGAFWLSEDTLGGVGVVEEIANLCEKEPRRWTKTIEAVLAPSDIELSVSAIRVLCNLIRDDDEVDKLVRRNCESTSHTERDELRRKLFSVLSERGYIVGRTFSASANARLFRPGMRRTFFALLADLDDYRHRLQNRLGIQIDLRIFCRIAAMHQRFGSLLREEFKAIRGSDLPPGEAAQLLEGILWPQSSEIRVGSLSSYHPFRQGGAQEPGLVRAIFFSKSAAFVSVSDSDWFDRVAEMLANEGVARLTISRCQQAELRKAITRVIASPIDVGWMQLYAAIERIEGDAENTTAVLVIREWN